MKSFIPKGSLQSIPERLAYLRLKRDLTLQYVAGLFKVNKSTVLRWESPGYWNDSEIPAKRLLLMQLAELYQADQDWVLRGELFQPQNSTNILVVDDDRTSLSIMSLIIKSVLSSQYQLFSFQEPELALAWAEHHDAALVFCDYRMPTMKGDQFLFKLKAQRNYQHTPVIAITQVREPGVKESMMSAGASHVLQKSVNKQELHEVLSVYN